ncbi:unnamed protein product, partial [Laminaria digitata]
LEDYLELLLPVLLRILERRDVGLSVRNVALAVVLHLTADGRCLFDSASRIVHSLIRLVATEGKVAPTSASTSSATVAAARSVM